MVTTTGTSKYDGEWEPRIIGFCCNWCSYAGADLAGVSRLQLPTNFRIIRVMCSGRVDPLFILKALESGADGIFVMGCHPGDCHYISGNLKAERRAKFLGAILDQIGLGGRFELSWVSASEGPVFQRTVSNFIEKIKSLGPSPLNPISRTVPLSKENQKRAYIHYILVSLAKAMEYHPDESFEIPEDYVMEGYGFLKWDEEKCIGCGACYRNCPEHVIEMDDRDGWRYMGHSSFNCRTCRICEEICPQNAIHITRGFDLNQFLDDSTINDVDMSLRECSVCGEAFATDRHLDALKKKLTDGTPEKGIQGVDILDRVFEICPDCKMKEQARIYGGRI